MFSYFFEFKKGNSIISSQINANKPIETSQTPNVPADTGVCFRMVTWFLRITILLVIFLMATLTLLFNYQKSEQITSLTSCSKQNAVEQVLGYLFSLNWSHHLINEFRNLIYAALSMANDIFKIDQDIMDQDQLFSYFNKQIHFYLILIYILSCLLIVTWSKASPQKNLNLKLVCFIWINDLVLILLNYKEYTQYFKSDYKEILISLNYVFICMSLIQAAVLIQLSILIVKFFMKNTHLKQEKCERNVLASKIVNKFESPFNASHISDDCGAQEITKVKYNYSTVTQNSYSLMKYLNSNDSGFVDKNNNNNINTKQLCKSLMNRMMPGSSVNNNLKETIKASKSDKISLIRPARFNPSTHGCQTVNWLTNRDSIGNCFGSDFVFA